MAHRDRRLQGPRLPLAGMNDVLYHNFLIELGHERDDSRSSPLKV